jgi:hypothetical protein
MFARDNSNARRQAVIVSAGCMSLSVQHGLFLAMGTFLSLAFSEVRRWMCLIDGTSVFKIGSKAG